MHQTQGDERRLWCTLWTGQQNAEDHRNAGPESSLKCHHKPSNGSTVHETVFRIVQRSNQLTNIEKTSVNLYVWYLIETLEFTRVRIIVSDTQKDRNPCASMIPFVFASIPYSDTLLTRVFCDRTGHAGTLRCSMVGANYGFHPGAEIVPWTRPEKNGSWACFGLKIRSPGRAPIMGAQSGASKTRRKNGPDSWSR